MLNGNSKNKIHSPLISTSSANGTSNISINRENLSRNGLYPNSPFYDIAVSWKRDHPSAFSPYKPTTVLTNLQRGNVQTQTISVPLERSAHQLAAQGELFIENIVDVFEPEGIDKNGFTPVMWAAAYGQLETVRQLISLGASVSTLSPSGENALLFASSAGHCAIVKELLSHGASVDYKDKVVRLLSHYSQFNRVLGKCGTYFGIHHEIPQDGNTALMYAAFNDHATCVQELLNAGADFTLLNEAFESSYDISIRRRSKNAQAVLEKYSLALLSDAKENI